MFDIRLHRSGDGAIKSLFEIRADADGVETKVIGGVDSLEAGKALVYALDERFAQWEKSGFPDLPENDPLHYYEGCDISARNLETGAIFYLEGTEDGDIWYAPEV